MTYRKDQVTSKLGTSDLLRNIMAGAYLLAMWCPVFRWRDSDPGSGTELERAGSGNLNRAISGFSA
jgi:hypothetical protein